MSPGPRERAGDRPVDDGMKDHGVDSADPHPGSSAYSASAVDRDGPSVATRVDVPGGGDEAAT